MLSSLCLLCHKPRIPAQRNLYHQCSALPIRYSNSCWKQKINHCPITQIITIISKNFYFLIRNGIFYNNGSLYLMNSFHWAFYNIILFLQPRKKCGKTSTNIINSYLSTIIYRLILYLYCSLSHKYHTNLSLYNRLFVNNILQFPMT